MNRISIKTMALKVGYSPDSSSFIIAPRACVSLNSLQRGHHHHHLPLVRVSVCIFNSSNAFASCNLFTSPSLLAKVLLYTEFKLNQRETGRERKREKKRENERERGSNKLSVRETKRERGGENERQREQARERKSRRER